MNQITKAKAEALFLWKGGRGDSSHWRDEMSCATIRIGVQKKGFLSYTGF